MWYAVLRKELTLQEKFAGSTFTVPAGTVWNVKKDDAVGVRADNIDEASPYGPLHFTVKEAQLIFTRPTKDLGSAVEESFMVSEAVYC